MTRPAIGAWVALALILVGVVLALIPVRNGDVQDCGVPAAYILSGRPETPPPQGSPAGEGCRGRAADRVVPAAGLLLAGVLLGWSATIAGFVTRRRARRAVP